MPAIRPLFNYAMNSKSLANENSQRRSSPSSKPPWWFILPRSCSFPMSATAPLKLPITPLQQTSIPRVTRCSATPHCYTTRFSSRHNQGGNITFSDGHAAYYKYQYVVSDGTAVIPAGPTAGQTAAAGHDPGRADINWDCQGNPVINLISSSQTVSVHQHFRHETHKHIVPLFSLRLSGRLVAGRSLPRARGGRPDGPTDQAVQTDSSIILAPASPIATALLAPPPLPGFRRTGRRHGRSPCGLSRRHQQRHGRRLFGKEILHFQFHARRRRIFPIQQPAQDHRVL